LCVLTDHASPLSEPPHAPLCVITNHPARYRDPKTGLPFYNTYAFKEIQRLVAGEFKWSQLTGTWVGRGGDDAAQGVPARFTRPETEDEKKERLERKEREKKEADERKAQEEKEKAAAEEKAKLEAVRPPPPPPPPPPPGAETAGTLPTTTTEPRFVPMAPMDQSADTLSLPVTPRSAPVPVPVPNTASMPPPPSADGAAPLHPPPGVPPSIPPPGDTKPELGPTPPVPEQAAITGEMPAPDVPTLAMVETDTVMTPAPPLGTGTDQA
jgi:vacuolar protein sorting-associated protein 72